MSIATPSTSISAPPRRVTILGSTGSVGKNTVKLLLETEEAFEVEAITAYSNVELLAAQAKQLRAKLAVIADETHYQSLKNLLSGTGIEALAGKDALVEAAARQSDWVMAAIVGTAGLYPTLTAIRRGAVVALANKECLVSAGGLMMEEVKRCGATLVPVDSEHNAIFQVLDATQPEKVESIILTASGGPFLAWERVAMVGITPAQAVNHPNWSMGTKISIDSATMMNKGLELIEAYHLFPVEASQIQIVVHPESIVHSMVAYKDGSVLAQLGTPDMCVPISYALGWPKRIETCTPRLNLTAIGKLTFKEVDEVKFPALKIAREALIEGGAFPAIMNAANEVAVEAFTQKHIGFLDIIAVVEKTLERVQNRPLSNLAEVMEIDSEARRIALDIIQANVADTSIMQYAYASL